MVENTIIRFHLFYFLDRLCGCLHIQSFAGRLLADQDVDPFTGGLLIACVCLPPVEVPLLLLGQG